MAERLVARSASMLSMSALAPAGLAILGRRWFLGYLTISGCLLLSCCSLIYEQAGGNFDGPPEGIPWLLSPEARRLLADAFRGLEDGGVVDYHVHAVGLGAGGSGIEVNPTCLSWWYPVRRLRTGVFLSAAGILGSEDPDRDYLVRLAALARPFPVPLTCYLYAMDRTHRPDGTPDRETTTFHVPNEYVSSVAARFPGRLVAVASVHPYRPDAIEELERCASRGIRHIKWIPNSMGIDPSSERIVPFYRRMQELGMVLLSHTGDEHALEVPGGQRLGNPLLLRRPLDLGLTVVALHCGGVGEGEDLESPGLERVANSDLFLRLLEDPRYDGRLFGETSSLTYYNFVGRPLRTLLGRPDLHRRLVHGSDYPVAGINLAIRTSRLVDEGFIAPEDRAPLNEIYRRDPLLFDFVVQRTVRHPETGRRFDACVFRAPPETR